MKTHAPKYALEVLSRLEKHGYKAYLVGGCVRDLLMDKRPNDWDICTSALPGDVMAVFPHSRPTGIQHGTVTVSVHGSALEVTTFRADGDYLDHRRPKSVSFLPDLEGDLQRRDFTINAMALSLSGEILDPCGGKTDLNNRLIRCVGDPDKRFSEDALRMLRALRFSASTGFDIDENTMSALRRCAPLCASLAHERIATELQKALLSPAPQRAAEMIEFGLLCGVEGVTPVKCDLSSLSALPKNRAMRWCAAVTLLRRSGAIEDEKSFLAALRLDSATIYSCTGGSAAAEDFPQSKASLKHLVSALGEDAALCAAAAAQALGHERCIRRVREILRSGECLTIQGLAVSGGDMLALGIKGQAVGKALRALLDYVLENPEKNDRATLLYEAQHLIATQRGEI